MTVAPVALGRSFSSISRRQGMLPRWGRHGPVAAAAAVGKRARRKGRVGAELVNAANLVSRTRAVRAVPRALGLLPPAAGAGDAAGRNTKSHFLI